MPSKSQFSATEALVITLPPFWDELLGDGDLGEGVLTVGLTITRPDTTALPDPPVPALDAATGFRTAQIPVGSFQEGTWLIKAILLLDGIPLGLVFPQFESLTWGGGYVDQIADIHAAALGRWKISNNRLTLYAADGFTIFKTYDLKDEGGLPTQSRIFERTPV